MIDDRTPASFSLLNVFYRNLTLPHYFEFGSRLRSQIKLLVVPTLLCSDRVSDAFYLASEAGINVLANAGSEVARECSEERQIFGEGIRAREEQRTARWGRPFKNLPVRGTTGFEKSLRIGVGVGVGCAAAYFRERLGTAGHKGEKSATKTSPPPCSLLRCTYIGMWGFVCESETMAAAAAVCASLVCTLCTQPSQQPSNHGVSYPSHCCMLDNIFATASSVFIA